MFALLIVFATAVLCIIKVYRDRRDYFKNLGIPGPEPKLFTGNAVGLYEKYNPSPYKLRAWTKKYGKVYGILEGFQRVLVVSDLDMLQEIFVKKFDDFHGRKPSVFEGDVDNDPKVHMFSSRGVRWKRLRSLASPAFSANSLKKVRPTVEDSIRNFLKHLEKHVDGDAFNIHENLYELTLDVILRVAMGQKTSVQFQNPLIKQMVKFFGSEPMNNTFFVACQTLPHNKTLAKSLKWLAEKSNIFEAKKILDQCEEAVKERIKARENGAVSSQSDFIDLFLDVTVDGTIADPEMFSKNNVTVQRAMSWEEVVAQCFVFLLAGFDTTANSMATVMYYLMKNPEAKQKLIDEIDAHCTEEDISMDTINNMKYLDCVMKEGLRLNPLAAIAVHRECQNDTEICGMKIEKGVAVWADVWSIHYDKTLWGDDADEFRPERFESGDRRHLMSWFPFGEGPRKCAGIRLAYLEEKLTLAHFFRTYDIVAGPKTESEIELIGAMTTAPVGVHTYLKQRS